MLAAVAGAVAAEPPRLAAPLERPALALRVPEHGALLGLARCGDQRIVAVGERGVVLLSDDAGASWRQAAAVPVSVTLTAVQCTDARHGVALGHQGVVLTSDDGGERWTRRLDGAALAQLLLAEARAGGDAKALAEAERAVDEGADKPLLALQFANPRDGLAVGAFGIVLATADGGSSWTSIGARVPNPKAAHLYAIDRRGDEVLIAGEQGLLVHSADGGAHYARIATPYAGSWFAVAHEAAGGWLVAGLRGNVLRSTDAGRSWTALTGAPAVSVTALAAAAGGGVLLANQGGELLVPDGAARLKTIATSTAQQPAGLLQLADGALLVAGWNGLTRVSAP